MKSLPLIFTLGAAASIHTNAVAQQKFAPLCPDGVKVFYARLGSSNVLCL